MNHSLFSLAFVFSINLVPLGRRHNAEKIVCYLSFYSIINARPISYVHALAAGYFE